MWWLKGAERQADWESKRSTFVEQARPEDFVLRGDAAASHVQVSLDAFVSKVYEGFDDNSELGELIATVIAGHHEKMISQDSGGSV